MISFSFQGLFYSLNENNGILIIFQVYYLIYINQT